MKKIILFFCFCLSAFAASRPSPSEGLQGIFVVSPDEGYRRPSAYYFRGVEIEGLNLTVKEENKLRKKLEKHYLGQPISESLVLSVKNTIRNFYRSMGRPVLLVQTPSQELTQGVLTVEVVESSTGDVRVKGNRWVSSQTIAKAISVKPGQPIQTDRLVADLAWLNRNPFREVGAVFQPGSELDTTDIELIVKDRFPLRVYAGLDNSGFTDTDPQRFFAGFNWGDAFEIDHILSYQYTASLDFKKLQAHTINYTAPLSWHHIFNVFGGYSRVDVRLNPTARTKGHSSQLSGRYIIPLGPHRNFLHELKFGLDFKRTNNNLTFGGTRVSGSHAQIFQFMGGYDLTWSPQWYRLYLNLELFWSPGHMIGDQKNVDYQALRPFATSEYVYGRAALQQTFTLPMDFGIDVLLRGQGANRNLLPSEQFGLGGYYSVRGYREREVNVDNAFLATIEISSPKVHVMKYIDTCNHAFRNVNDELWFLIFFDYAFGTQHHRIPNEKRVYHLSSIGPAVRYNIGPWLTFRTDWGIQLHRTGRSNRWTNINFMLIVAY